MNRVRHKWLATVAKTHFDSCEAHPLGAIFLACELYLSLFYFGFWQIHWEFSYYVIKKKSVTPKLY